MTPALLTGFSLGLGAAAPIGPINVEIARRALRHGWLAGFLVGCGAVAVDCFYLLLSTLSLHRLLHIRWFNACLGLAGGIFLAWLGFLSILAARRVFILDQTAGTAAPLENSRNNPVSPANHFLTGLLMTLLNPMTLAFWFLSVPAAAGPAQSLPWVCGGVFLGAFAWVCFFSTLIHHAGRRRRQGFLVAADLLGGLTLLYYSLGAIWRVTQLLL